VNLREIARVSLDDCRAVRLGLASPEDVLAWSHGEVQKAETINYRTGRPVPGGLFCERIFGPEKDWECACGKYRGLRYRGTTCERCQVVVNHSRVRRKRMGHIELAAPVVHIWFWKVLPSCLANLFDLTAAAVEKVIYHHEYVVTDPGGTGLRLYQLLDEGQIQQARARHGDAFTAGTGAEAVLHMLRGLDLAALAGDLRRRLQALEGEENASEERQSKLVRRLKIVDGLLRSGNRPEWMVLRRVPVLPPDLRPLVRLETGNYASSDLNDLYRRIIHRNTRLQKLQDMQAPEVILRNEKRLLQQAVDALFDNNRCKHTVSGASRRPLKSLADMLQGKQGRFRENLLGKRVDYSARSVIVVGPGLKLHQCGLPKAIALELFQPFLIHRLREAGLAATIRRARDLIRRRDEGIWDLLAEVMKGHPVLLNRAPTLHRMGIQAFEPVLIEGNAIQLHPLVCKGFNADFDGDQMAVHLPLSTQARVEASVLLMSTCNIFSPANGKPIIAPSQDMVLGCYYLTAPKVARSLRERGTDSRSESATYPKVFHGAEEVVQAFAHGEVGVHDRIQVRLPFARKVIGEVAAASGEPGVVELPRRPHGRVATTVGRVLFNDELPAAMPFYDLPLTAGNLSRIIADAHALLGRAGTIALLDRVKEVGFQWATRSGVSFATADLLAPAGKDRLLAACEKEVEKVQEQYERGNITAGERQALVIDLWSQAHRQIGDDLMASLAGQAGGLNPIHVMCHSGARGSREQVRQLAGMRGLMARPSGEILETPIKSNFREGLSVLEYFSSTHGARKGLADTALKTADSGYLTRKLADVAQNVVITLYDCETTRGVRKAPRAQGAALVGRVSMEDIAGPEGAVLRAGDMISAAQARHVADLGRADVLVRSPMTCEAGRGVCRLCYGMDRSTGALAEEGLAVGILAAQSIGEPATQLTLRTFHLGGTATLSATGGGRRMGRTREGMHTQDITTGLPRVIEVFEAQRSRRSAVLAEVSGVVRVGGDDERRRGRQVVFIRPAGGPEHAQRVPAGHVLRVETGDRVEAGDPLTDGPVAPQDVLRVGGAEAVQRYLLEEAQNIYRAQAIEIDDKHLEVIIAQMLRRVKVKCPGDTELLPGSVLDRFAFRAVNDRLGDCVKIKDAGASCFASGQVVPREAVALERARLKAAGLAPMKVVRPRPATCVPLVLGVSRAALQSDSFLAAASFQETSKVLTEAALAGRVDELAGLKENVLLGQLVPAGTGYRKAGG
jgi:DNA-directed RNA polymerase subunit beta'